VATVLITGGNRGIGLEVTRRFVARGDQVVVVARNFEGFALAEHPQVRCITADLSEIDRLPELMAAIGAVDVLINNAGVMFSIPPEAYTEEKKSQMLRLNLEAPVALMQLAIEGMKAKGGRIVNNASIAGQIGHPDIWYGMTKAALINATKSFAKLYGKNGIIINAVAPSPVETDMLEVIPKARRDAFLQTVISGRFARADEVADAIFWLATDAPEYINGSTIDLNDGSFPR